MTTTWQIVYENSFDELILFFCEAENRKEAQAKAWEEPDCFKLVSTVSYKRIISDEEKKKFKEIF
jgi:hypothetical protein